MATSMNREDARRLNPSAPVSFNPRLMRDLRYSLFRERVVNISNALEQGKLSRKAAAARLREALGGLDD